jgi:hypothetical protein
MRKTIVNATAKAGEIRAYAEQHGQQNLRAANSIAFLWLPLINSPSHVAQLF